MKNPIDIINESLQRLCDRAMNRGFPERMLATLLLPWMKIYFVVEKGRIERFIATLRELVVKRIERYIVPVILSG